MGKELRKKGYQLKYLLKAMPMAKSTYYFEIGKIDVVAEGNQDLKVLYFILIKVGSINILILEMLYKNMALSNLCHEKGIAIEEYIDHYNNKRIQAKTKWMPPAQCRIASMCSA